MAAYKKRLAQDLDRWIAAGLIPAERREALLASVPDARRLDAATSLAWVGGVLLGIAVIAFIAANWEALPRLARFGLILCLFAATAGAGAWAAHRARPVLSNIALMLAALIFAAAIGLTGQIFDIAGDPQAALRGAGLAAFALAIAGRSTGAATAGLAFIGLGDFDNVDLSGEGAAPWLIVAAPLGAFLCLRWGSAPLAHASALGVLLALVWFAARFESDSALLLAMSVLLAGCAGGARWLFLQERRFASVFYGWAAWGALCFFAAAGYADSLHGGEGWGLAHRLVWLLASGGLIALGRLDRHLLATTVGVLSLIGAIAAILMDLGLDLMTAAMLFFVCAIAALVGGLMLRRKASAT